MFHRNMSLPSSRLKKPAWKQVAGRAVLSCFAYSLTLKVEATCSSKTSVDFQRTTWHYIPQDRTLHNHHYENLKSYISSCNSWYLGQNVILFPVLFCVFDHHDSVSGSELLDKNITTWVSHCITAGRSLCCNFQHSPPLLIFRDLQYLNSLGKSFLLAQAVKETNILLPEAFP
jgi:hypothetical protein